MIKTRFIINSTVIFFLAFAFYGCEEYSTDNDGSRLSQPTSISDLRRVSLDDKPTFGVTAIPAVVISDNTAGNLPVGSMVIQDPSNTAAIIIDFDDADIFKVNDYFNINLEGSTIAKEEGLLVIKDVTRESFSFPAEAYSVSSTPVDITLFGDEVQYTGPILARIQSPMIMEVDEGVYSDDAYLEDEYGFTAELGILPESDINNQPIATTTPNSVVGLTFVENERLTIYPRTVADFVEAPPVDTLYEGFEKNTGYLTGSETFDLGIWHCTDAGSGTDSGWILKEGNYAVRMVGSYNSSTNEITERGALEMGFGVKNVWKLEFKTSLYLSRQEFWNANKTSVKVQMSVDDGANWADLLDEIGNADYEVQWNKSDNIEDRTPDATWLQTVTREIPNPSSESVRFRIINSSEALYFKDPNKGWAWGYYSKLPRIIIDGFTMYIDENKALELP
ncbi:MAG: DUF5689 domain-containing protein [Mangrovibacterium sp.]